jgi:PAS domain S-box-containing protein
VASNNNRADRRQTVARRVAEHAPALLSYLDPDLRERFADRRCYELVGRAPREMLGRLLAELLDERTLRNALAHVEHGCGAGDFAHGTDAAARRAGAERLPCGTEGGSWEWNLRANEVYYSPEFKALLGYEQARFPADFSFLSALHPKDRRGAFDALAASLQGDGRAFDQEFRMRGADGGYRWLRGLGKALQDPESGAAVRFVGTARDISARRRAQAELRDARELVDAALVAALEPLPDGADCGPGESRQSFLDLALRNAEQLARVVEQWLDLERIDLGLAQVRRVALALHELVAAQMRANGAAAVQRGVELDTVESGNVQVEADPERLAQAVSHLIASAIGRSSRGAVVRVRVGARGDRAVLLVEDEGADFLSSPDLGLSACQALVERQGGLLQLANRAVRGAAFHVELPCT